MRNVCGVKPLASDEDPVRWSCCRGLADQARHGHNTDVFQRHFLLPPAGERLFKAGSPEGFDQVIHDTVMQRIFNGCRIGCGGDDNHITFATRVMQDRQ